MMKHYAVFVLLSISAINPMQAQWVQTSLGDAWYGYNLFSDQSGIWAATLNGVYYTAESGSPWFSQGLANRLVFDVIKSGSYLLAATEGSGPGVFRSSDNGTTWLPANGIADQSVRAFTKNSSYVFACTWGGGIFRSNDNGATWQSVGLTNHGFRSMFTVGEQVFAGGDSVFFSGNNGTSWSRRGLPNPASDTWCFAYHNGNLYAGDAGLYVSADMGASWSLHYGVTFDSTGTPTDVKMFRDLVPYNQVLIASIAFNGIHVSSDNGASWSSWNEGVMPDWTFAGLSVRSPYVWALTAAFGNAYRRPLSDIVTDVGSSTALPDRPALSQNYPNPFNPSTTISYEVSDRAFIEVNVFNILGEKVATLAEKEHMPGRYDVRFDAKGLGSGVYICRLQAGGYIQTRKMLVLR